MQLLKHSYRLLIPKLLIMKLTICSTIVVLLFTSCNKDATEETEIIESKRQECPPEYVVTGLKAPEIPLNDTYWVDTSANIYFQKSYDHIATNDIPSSGQSISGLIMASRSVQFAFNLKNPLEPYAFHGQTVNLNEMQDGTSWISSRNTVISNHGCYGRYKEKWIIRAESLDSFYVLFRTEDETIFGWLKVVADESNGEFELLDHYTGTESTMSLP